MDWKLFSEIEQMVPGGSRGSSEVGTPLDHALLDKICLQFPASCPSKGDSGCPPKGDSGCPHPMVPPGGSEEMWFTIPRQRPADTKCSVSQSLPQPAQCSLGWVRKESPTWPTWRASSLEDIAQGKEPVGPRVAREGRGQAKDPPGG